MKIKVIKKGEIKTAAVSEMAEKKNTKETAREMVSTVTNWVSELQNRKREETKIALENFFKQPTQAN